MYNSQFFNLKRPFFKWTLFSYGVRSASWHYFCQSTCQACVQHKAQTLAQTPISMQVAQYIVNLRLSQTTTDAAKKLEFSYGSLHLGNNFRGSLEEVLVDYQLESHYNITLARHVQQTYLKMRQSYIQSYLYLKVYNYVPLPLLMPVLTFALSSKTQVPTIGHHRLTSYSQQFIICIRFSKTSYAV